MPDESHEPMGPRNTWVQRAWLRDTCSITRWFELDTIATVKGISILLIRRILGWDDSPPPTWVSEMTGSRVTTTVRELATRDFLELLDAPTQALIRKSKREVRRLEPPISDWYGTVDSEAWNLNLPLVLYEVWASDTTHAEADAVWRALDESERDATGITPRTAAYIGSTVLLIPQSKSFFAGVENLVIVGDDTSFTRPISLVSEVLDGKAVLSRVSGPLRLEAPRVLTPRERLRYLRVHFRQSAFAAMNAPVVDEPASAVAQHPQSAHGLSGSDWSLSVIDPTGTCDVSSVGLIRGIGGGYFTKQPWRERAPALGFSAPASVVHVSRAPQAGAAALQLLEEVGAPAALCDPYAEPQRLQAVMRGGRVLTSAKQLQRRRAGQ